MIDGGMNCPSAVNEKFLFLLYYTKIDVLCSILTYLR